MKTYDFDTATRPERLAHCAGKYCITIMEEREKLARLKEAHSQRGERYRAARGIGSWMKLVAGLANAIETAAREHDHERRQRQGH